MPASPLVLLLLLDGADRVPDRRLAADAAGQLDDGAAAGGFEALFGFTAWLTPLLRAAPKAMTMTIKPTATPEVISSHFRSRCGLRGGCGP